jgi:hypothetical protein
MANLNMRMDPRGQVFVGFECVLYGPPHRPPFLTASGDLSHHLGQLAPVFQPRQVGS